MADVGSVLEIESGSIPALVIDISAEVPGEARQTLGEPGHHTPLVTTVEDDSVFYCEDEIPQPEHGPSTFISVGAAWPAGFENVSQIRDLGTDNSKQSVCDSVGLTEEGSVHPSASRVMDVENSIGKKVSHVPSPVTVPTEESASGPASSSSAAPGNEHSALQRSPSAAVKGARLHVEEKKQMEEILLTHTQTDAPTEAQSEQDGGAQERGVSRNTHEQVGEIPRPPSGASADELGIFSLGNSNGVQAGLTISFNHLTHEKYGTVSYRQIRRGHTRQRIEEFESKMQL